MIRTTILPAATLALVFTLTVVSAAAGCEFKFCKSRFTEPPKTYPVTNNHRQRVGDIYKSGHGRRLQIRNDHRQIIGYIEHDGTVTHRQRIGTIDLD